MGLEIDPNRELVGLGAANLASGLSGGFACFGSLCRTPLMQMAGARTRMAGVVTALLVLTVVLTLTSALRYLPKPVMAAVIIVAITKMVDFKEVPYLWRVRKAEVALWLIPFVGTLLVGMNEGLDWTLALCVVRRAPAPATDICAPRPPRHARPPDFWRPAILPAAPCRAPSRAVPRHRAGCARAEESDRTLPRSSARPCALDPVLLV